MAVKHALAELRTCEPGGALGCASCGSWGPSRAMSVSAGSCSMAASSMTCELVSLHVHS